MNPGATECDEEVRLYADSFSSRFALRHDGGRWVKEFPTLPDAIRFLMQVPRKHTMKVVLFDYLGNPLTHLLLRPC